MNKELKACPFCNAKVVKALSDVELCEDYFSDELQYKVVCDIHEGGCGAASGYYYTKEDAIKAWNRRAYEN